MLRRDMLSWVCRVEILQRERVFPFCFVSNPSCGEIVFLILLLIDAFGSGEDVRIQQRSF